MGAGIFSPLSDSIIDQETTIAIHACGVGNNAEFVESFAQVFRSRTAIPRVIAPKHFEFYTSGTDQLGNEYSKFYMARSWMVSFRKGEKPGDIKLCNLLHEKYPDAPVDWQDALRRPKPRFGGDTYHYTFDIPVNLVIYLSANDSLPDFTSSENQLNWINQQSQIQHILSNMQIPARHFSWTLKKGSAKDKSGVRTTAISVKGFCTMLCILKPLTAEKLTSCGNAPPFVPALTDTAFYYYSGGKSCNIKS
jgi:hypothetical protein